MEIDKTARRVLGALIEKRWTTPEQYPLTLNSLVAACNQKSNRDPEMQLEEFIIEGCLYQLRLQELVMVVERDTGRAVRYSERLSEKLDLSRQDQAILAELMLRGPQTSPELFRRATRMADFKSPEEIEAILQGMAGKRWTHLLPRETGQRHARWKHLFAPAAEALDESPPAAASDVRPAAAAVPAAAPAKSALEATLGEMRAEIAELRARIERLEG